MQKTAVFLLAFVGAIAAAQTTENEKFEAALPAKSSQGIVAQRNFFALTEAAMRNDVVKVMAEDNALSELRATRSEARDKALSSCKTVECLDAPLRWSDADVKTVSDRLMVLVNDKPVMKAYAKLLRASGRYPLYAAQDDVQLVATAWMDAAKGLNRIVDVYGDGQKPHYDKIDSIRYDPKSRYYFDTVRATVMLVQDESYKEPSLFFPEIKYAAMLLAANGRLDAARDWPLETAKNAAAVVRARSTRWEKYPYSVIVVPGQGPEIAEEEFSPRGRVVVELAVRSYREGKAPFLLVSGGSVHPELTKYVEAYEMKRELMTQWGVPESAIIVEPYARHTTTNLRNAVREMVQYGFPMKKPMLVVTDFGQADSIASAKFDARCMNEMRLVPYTQKKRVSVNEISMAPDVVSLQMDANDPMDP